MKPEIPATIDDVSSEWLTAALGKPVTALETTQIGVGIGVSSALYRVLLSVGDHSDLSSVIVKLPALDEAAVFTSSVLRLYHREVRFYQELAQTCPIQVPTAYYADLNEETSQFVLVLEDMSSLRMVDQIQGMNTVDAQRAVDELAGWHAHWWNSADPIVERGTALAITDPIYPAVLPSVFAEGWEKINSSMAISPEIVSVGSAWTDAVGGMLQELGSAPTTLSHGDYRADNMLFHEDGSLLLLDFQLIGSGTAAFDLAYFVTGSLTASHASAQERSLFERWRTALVAGGVSEAETDMMWDKYRLAALFCLVYPVVASRGMDLSDERQRSLINLMNERFTRAIDELNLRDLI